MFLIEIHLKKNTHDNIIHSWFFFWFFHFYFYFETNFQKFFGLFTQKKISRHYMLFSLGFKTPVNFVFRFAWSFHFRNVVTMVSKINWQTMYISFMYQKLPIEKKHSYSIIKIFIGYSMPKLSADTSNFPQSDHKFYKNLDKN